MKRRPPNGNARLVRSNGRNIRSFVVDKNYETQQAESFQESKHMLRLDRDPTVIRYLSQPETFTLVDDNGKVRKHTPDFKVWKADGSVEIHDITLEHRLSIADFKIVVELMRSLCSNNGWKYIVYTEKDIPQGNEAANLKALKMFRAAAYNDGSVAMVAIDVLSHGSLRLDQLALSLQNACKLPRGTINATLWHLLWHGKIEADLRKPLFDDGLPVASTKVWLPEGYK
jgi:hypothetical protein